MTAGSRAVAGPRRRRGRSDRLPIPGAVLLIGVTVAVCALGFLEKLPCHAGGWNVANFQYRYACYSDIYPLYFVRGIDAGQTPYLEAALEYPVLIGALLAAGGWLTRDIADPVAAGLAFFDINVLVLTLCAVVAVLGVAGLAGRRPRDALLVALSPGLALAAFINWDLAAVAFSVLGLLAWARRRPALAGALLGLAVATKFYPLIFLGPLFVLCLRAGRLRQFLVTTATAAAAWLAVNLPVMWLAPRRWAEFYNFSQERGADWGSLWYLFQTAGVPVLGTTDLERLNLMASGAFLACCLAIAVLALAAPRRPRLAQLLFLTLAAFLVTNKVWSPQYVLWLLPLVALARPRWPAFLAWQAAEVWYFLAIWWYLLHVATSAEGTAAGIGPAVYFSAVALRAAAILLLAGLVVREILDPERDVVRAAGMDDPAGGVLDGAPDLVARSPAVRPAESA